MELAAIFNGLKFNNPLFFALIPFAAALLFVISTLFGRFHRRMVAAFGERKTLEGFSHLRGARVRNILYLTLALSSLLLALAEPVTFYKASRVEKTFNYVAVVDVSRSMGAEDYYPQNTSRIEVARQSLFRLYEAYPKGAAGLVFFTNQIVSYEITTDRKVLRFLTRYVIDLDRAKGAGSDLAAGLEEALELIESSPQAVKTIILLSDGGGSSPTELWGIAPSLKEANVRVIAAGFGGNEPVRIPNRDPETGEIVGYHRLEGSYATTKLNEQPLVALAEMTGGNYTRIWKDEGEELVQIVHKGNYASSILFDEGEEKNLTRLPLAAFPLILVVWMVDKRFFQG